MAKKKKNKSRINAIDKYLQQKKYREGPVKEKRILLKSPKVVIPRIKSSRLLELTGKCELTQISSISKKKIPVVPVTSVSEKHSQTKKYQKKREARNQSSNTKKKRIKPTAPVISSGNVTKPDLKTKLAPDHFNSDNEVERGFRKREGGRSKKKKNKENQITAKVLPVASSHVSLQLPCDCIVNSSLEKKDEVEIAERKTLIIKKYQPYMDRIKLLTPEAIAKFIKDNREYYVKLKKETELKKETCLKNSKKYKDERKEAFKCNPFNSRQQVAMYLMLREIFNVPPGEFQTCRIFFTVLLPEISCQLFADIFRIKPSFAPRLIKKLYPNPICPV